MKSCREKIGLTLMEMLIVVAIIAVLVSITIGVASRIDNQSREHLVRGTISLLDMALTQFADYGYRYKVGTIPNLDEKEFYLGLDFPVDCNDFDRSLLAQELARVLAFDPAAAAVIPPGADYDRDYSGSEALYFFLSRIPACRKTLERIDASLLTDEDASGHRMQIQTRPMQLHPLLRIIDPWGRTLRYDYYDEMALVLDGTVRVRENSKKNFPVITSAGPDGEFGTGDDITSR